MTHNEPGAKPRVLITSYGMLHGEASQPLQPVAPVKLDLTDALRNPHDDPDMRYRTGFDEDVYGHVMSTPGAVDYRVRAVGEVLARIDAGATLVEVHSYCRGGRHRSVALAEAIRAELAAQGIDATHDARDVGKPVIQPVPAAAKGA